MSDELKYFLLTLLSGLLALIFIFMGLSFIDLRFFKNVPVSCWIDGKKVYEGISAGIDIKSAGANTIVKINGGFMYLFPKAYYVSNNVVLINMKEEK